MTIEYEVNGGMVNIIARQNSRIVWVGQLPLAVFHSIRVALAHGDAVTNPGPEEPARYGR